MVFLVSTANSEPRSKSPQANIPSQNVQRFRHKKIEGLLFKVTIYLGLSIRDLG